MTYAHPLRVRYAETDQMGIVHHANYLLYVEEARTAYMAELGIPYGAIERSGVGLAVRKVEFRYRAPARYEDELVVMTRIGRLGAASIGFIYEIERPIDRTRIASASTELACIDLGKERRPPRPLPDELRAALAPLESEPSG